MDGKDYVTLVEMLDSSEMLTLVVLKLERVANWCPIICAPTRQCD